MKKHSLAFRRWLMGTSSSSYLVSKLSVKSRKEYKKFFEQFFEYNPWAQYPKMWHIDHVVPLCMFNESEIGLAWSQENLKPLPPKANKRKGASAYEATQEILARLKDNPKNKNLIALKVKLDKAIPKVNVRKIRFFK